MVNTSFAVRLKSLTEDPPWVRLAETFFGAMGIVWTSLELLEWAHKGWFPEEYRPHFIGGVAILSAIFAVTLVVPPLHYSRRFINLGLTIELKVGDLIRQKEPHHIAVLSSEYFDSCVKTAIHERSLKGQIIKTFYNGNKDDFDKEVDSSLTRVKYVGVHHPDKKFGTNRLLKFQVGATASVPIGDSQSGKAHRAMLVVGPTFDHQTTMTSTSASNLWESLLALWRDAPRHLEREPFSVPIWGAKYGNARSGPLLLFQIMLLSLAVSVRESGIPTTRLSIVVYHKEYDAREFQEMGELLKHFAL